MLRLQTSRRRWIDSSWLLFTYFSPRGCNCGLIIACLRLTSFFRPSLIEEFGRVGSAVCRRDCCYERIACALLLADFGARVREQHHMPPVGRFVLQSSLTRERFLVPDSLLSEVAAVLNELEKVRCCRRVRCCSVCLRVATGERGIARRFRLCCCG